MRELLRRGTLLISAAFVADRRAAWTALLLAPVVGCGAVLPGIGIGWLLGGAVAHQGGRVLAGMAVLLLGVLVGGGLGDVAASARIRLQLGVGRELDRRLVLLAAGVPTVAHHDDPAHRDRMDLVRAHRGELGGAIGAVVETLRAVVVVVSATVVLAGVAPVLVLIPLCAVPAVLATRRGARLVAAAEDRTAQRDRLRRSLLDAVTRPGPAAEWRIYGATAEIAERHRALADAVRRERTAADVRGTAAATACWFLYGCCLVGALALVVDRAVTGLGGPGEVALVVTVCAQVSGGMSGLVAMVRWLHDAVRAVGHVTWLVDHAAAQRAARRPVVDVAPRPGGDLVLDRVSFRYPGSDRLVLDRVSLRVPAGSTLAVVGDNGAGKSTLLALLAGVHEPTTGEIRYGGRPLPEWDPAAWWAGLTGCFQDFCRLERPLRDAVGVGDLPRRDDPAAVHAALDRAGAADLPALSPHGIDLQLGPTFDGTELSGGQWQRVALARAHMRTGPALLLLDEPTASLDPATENTLLTHYLTGAGAAAGTTTVVISHRFSTVRSADLIAVLDHGRLAQFGDHDSLLASGGRYADLHALHAYGYRR